MRQLDEMVFITPTIAPIVCSLHDRHSSGTIKKNVPTNDKVIRIGNLYFSSCEAVDENTAIKLFTDTIPRR